MFEHSMLCNACGAEHAWYASCKDVRAGAPGKSPARTQSAAAVVIATKNAANEIRLALRRVEPAPARPEFTEAEPTFIYSDEVQDSASTSRGEGSSGFGLLPRRTTFTRHAKRTVREGVAVLHELFGRQCVFATGTLPGSTPQALRAIACWSGYMNSRLNQWIRDTAPGAHVVWVWELQKRGALHLHAAIGAVDILELRRIERGFRDQWIRLLRTISERSGVDVFARGGGSSWASTPRMVRANCRPVRRNVAAYMSKYLSKNANSHAPDSAFCPSRWWGISDNLRAEVMSRRAIVVSPVVPLGQAIDWFESLAGPVADCNAPVYVFDNPWCPGDKTLVLCADDRQWRTVWTSLKNAMLANNRKALEGDAAVTFQLPAYLRAAVVAAPGGTADIDCDLKAYMTAVAEIFDGFAFGYEDGADGGGECGEYMNCNQGPDLAFLRVL